MPQKIDIFYTRDGSIQLFHVRYQLRLSADKLVFQWLFSWLLSTCWQQKVFILLSVMLLPKFYQVHDVETSNANATHIAQAASGCFTCLFPACKQIPHNWHDKSAKLIHCQSCHSVDARCWSYVYVWLRPATIAKKIASLLTCHAMLDPQFRVRDRIGRTTCYFDVRSWNVDPYQTDTDPEYPIEPSLF